MTRFLRSQVLWGVAAALLVAVPRVPLYRFVASDFLQLGILQETIERPGTPPFNLYDFSDGSVGLNRTLLASGEFPWFTDPAWKMRFFRPLSSALVALSYAGSGLNPFGYALQGLFWYVALVAALAALSRRVLARERDGSSLASYLPAVLFAFAARNLAPLSYGSARWVLVASTLGLLGVLAHLRWRQESWAAGRWLAPLALALSLLAGESGLAFAGFVVAWEVVPQRARGWWRAALPTALLVAVYLGLYLAGGYGTAGQDAYLSPADAPGAFLAAAPARASYVLGDMVLGTVSLFGVDPLEASPAVLLSTGIAAVAVLALLLVPVYRDASEERRRTLRWLVLGTAGSLVPSLAALPGSRVAIVPFVGGSILLAIALSGSWRRWRSRRSAATWAAGLLALALAGLHLVYSPYVWFAAIGPTRAYDRYLEAFHRRSGLEGIGLDDTVVFLDGSQFIHLYYEYNDRRVHGRAVPTAWRELSASGREHRYSRPDERTLDLELVGGGMFEDRFLYALRTRRRPLSAGDAVELPGLRVEILASGADGPTRLRYRFAHPLEDPRYRFYVWKDGAFAAEKPPAVGGRLSLE